MIVPFILKENDLVYVKFNEFDYLQFNINTLNLTNQTKYSHILAKSPKFIDKNIKDINIGDVFCPNGCCNPSDVCFVLGKKNNNLLFCCRPNNYEKKMTLYQFNKDVNELKYMVMKR